MSLKRQQHNTVAEASEDLRGLDDTKEEKVTFSTRTPTATDQGRFWLKYAAGAVTLYARHPNSGTWLTV